MAGLKRGKESHSKNPVQKGQADRDWALGNEWSTDYVQGSILLSIAEDTKTHKIQPSCKKHTGPPQFRGEAAFTSHRRLHSVGFSMSLQESY